MTEQEIESEAEKRYPYTYDDESSRMQDLFIEGAKFALEQQWVKITDDNIPDIEVLAISYRKDYLIGFVEKRSGAFVCENDLEKLDDITHYMPLPQPPKQNDI